MFRRLRLLFCGFLRGQPPLGMHLGVRESRRIQYQPRILREANASVTWAFYALQHVAASNAFVLCRLSVLL